MKHFFSRYSYDSMKMFLDQFAISLFGFSLALTANKMGNDTILLIFSLASILFYLVLLYGVAQRVGTRDKTTIGLGKMPFRPLTGTWIALLANSLNLILAVLVMILTFLPGDNAGMAQFAAMFLNGMYQGVYVVTTIGGVSLNTLWWSYFLLPLPAILVATLGYIAGVKDWHLTGLSTPELPASDRPTRKEIKERKQEAERKAAERDFRDSKH